MNDGAGYPGLGFLTELADFAGCAGIADFGVGPGRSGMEFRAHRTFERHKTACTGFVGLGVFGCTFGTGFTSGVGCGTGGEVVTAGLG